MSNGIQKSSNIRQWFNRALFNTDSANRYFETLAEGIDPMWSLTDIKAYVEGVQQETADAITVTLKPNARFEGFQAGQHLQVTFEINGSQKTRTFSISSSPGDYLSSKKIQLTIKAVEEGEVTQWIHQHLKAGDVVKLSPAHGEFTLPDPGTRALYIAGGSGITPVMSHIRQLLETNPKQEVSLLYYAKNSDDFIFQHELKAINKRVKNFKFYFIETRKTDSSDSTLSGHICDTHIERACHQEPDSIYLCGPSHLQESANECITALFGESKPVTQENFGLAIKPLLGSNKAQPVVFSHSNKQIDCDQKTPLLDAAQQAGLNPDHGCRMGICYTCKCKKKSGVVRNLVTGKLSGTEEEDIQLCVSVPETPTVIEL